MDQDQIAALLERRLSRVESEEVEQHVAVCAGCRALVAELARLESDTPESDSIETQAFTRPDQRRALHDTSTGGKIAERFAPARLWGDSSGEIEFNETYRIGRLIGVGGMGRVYEATHTRLHRKFAIKMLPPAIAQDPEYLARFEHEAEVSSRLSHPHIVEIVDFDRHADGTPYLVMELLEGETLGARLARMQGPMALDAVLQILRQLAQALDTAHKAGIVHRDLTPQNIFLCRRNDQDDFVKVMDFGISKMVGSASLTQSRVLLGTPHFMSPEQADCRVDDVDRRSDIFSVGAILYKMITGRVPFTGHSLPSVLYSIVHHQPDPPSRFRPELPVGIDSLILRALSKSPADRPSMEELSTDFANHLRLSRDAAAAPAKPRAVGLSKRALTVAIAAVSVLIVAALVAGLGRRMLHRPAEQSVTPALPVREPMQRSLLKAAHLDDQEPPASTQPATRSTRPAAVASPAAHRRPARGASATKHRSAAGFGTIDIQTRDSDGRPLWADVHLDGKHVGQSGLTLKHVPAGPHLVTIRREGFRTASQRFRLDSGQRLAIQLKLVR